MSASLTTALLPAMGTAARAVVHLLGRIGETAARWTLPLTGIALGAYLTVALVLITVGFVLRFLGERRAA